MAISARSGRSRARSRTARSIASLSACEEVAAICECATVTVKSRVARARMALRALLDGGQLTQGRADVPASDVSALDQIMDQARVYSVPRPRKEALLLP